MAVLICSILIGLAVFVFYKGIHSFLAYCLSDDLIDFFIKNRGVFSVSGVEKQNPFIGSNIIFGVLINPLIQLVSIYTLVEITKHFMLRLNKKFESDFFSATSLVYFSSFGILVFILSDIVSYLQSVSLLNTLTNVIFLIGSKVAYLIIAFGIWHIQLLNNKNYSIALFSDLKMNGFERMLITKPLFLLIFTYFVVVILNLPLYLGLQWNGSIWVVFVSLLCGIGLFFVLLIFTLSKGYNYLGVYMLDENREHQLFNKWQFKFLKKRTILIVLTVIVLFSILMSIKGFFFYAFYLMMFFTLLSLLIFGGYGIISLLNKSTIHWKIAFQMLYSSVFALIPLLIALLLVLTLFSVRPKTIKENVFDEYQTAIIDANGNLIYKSANNSENPSIPLSYNELPHFLVKALICKEDKALFKQNNLLFNRTNWHGTSMNFLVRRGGSNINQQLIKNLAFKGFFPQEFQRKYAEMIASYQLSMSVNPKTILNNYVNNVSFNGGMGHTGIVNASYYTFGRNIGQLNELELLYLTFTLHRGSSFKTESNIISYKEVHLHTSEIKDKLLVYAENWYNKGLLTKKEIKKLRNQKLDFTNLPYHLNNSTSKNTFFQNQIRVFKENIGFVYTSTLNKNVDDKILTAVNNFFNYFSDQKRQGNLELYGAALVVEVKTGKILGHYGGNARVDLVDFGEGFQTGSIIKPFVLLELLEAGHDIKLYDGKRNKQVANNYNKMNSNLYKDAKGILGPSLNSPFSNIDEITPPISLFQSVEEHFSLMNIGNDSTINLEDTLNYSWNKINYPLGSRRMTIWDIAQAYQTLFNKGQYVKIHCLSSVMDPYNYESKNIAVEQKEVYKAKNTDIITEALKSTLLSGGTAYGLNKILPQKNYMAKTGTTDKYRHGYTVLSDGDVLVVTWVSYGIETDGQLKFGQAPIPDYSGGASAGKLAAFIMQELQKP
ncbi:MAG: transglycosylase domain-containing protein [Candidatus Paceibacterota bacterium]|nr:transglycosylase domain-containing protein [Clostridia bacterium]